MVQFVRGFVQNSSNMSEQKSPECVLACSRLSRHHRTCPHGGRRESTSRLCSPRPGEISRGKGRSTNQNENLWMSRVKPTCATGRHLSRYRTASCGRTREESLEPIRRKPEDTHTTWVGTPVKTSASPEQQISLFVFPWCLICSTHARRTCSQVFTPELCVRAENAIGFVRMQYCCITQNWFQT